MLVIAAYGRCELDHTSSSQSFLASCQTARSNQSSKRTAIAPTVSVSSVSVVSNVSRTEDAVQQPQSYPVWRMLATGCAEIKVMSLERADGSILPCFDDCPLLALATDVVPEVRRPYGIVILLLLNKIRRTRIQLRICGDRFFLTGMRTMLSRSESRRTLIAR